jgi:hypothetical protein
MDPRESPAHFGLDNTSWKAWPGLATAVELHLVCLPPDQIFAVPRESGRVLGLGEQALATAAVARRLGCTHLVAKAGAFAAKTLRNPRSVQVLLEEGLPSPLTGRLGAIVSAAGDLSLSPPVLSPRTLQRLSGEGLGEQDVVDLILTAAMASLNCRLTLGLGRTYTP